MMAETLRKLVESRPGRARAGVTSRLTDAGASHALLKPGILEGLSEGWTWLAVSVALALIYALDGGTGSAPVQHLYYLPIIIASIRFAQRGSMIVAAAAIVLYHLANPHVLTLRYEESDVVQMALFIAVGLTASKMARDAQHLRGLAITDDLTGLHNLRSFETRLRMLVRSSRSGLPVALLVLDVDRLKSLNDVHGHLAGADAVRAVGRLIADCIPPDAVACRYGGDEFVIAVPHCGESEALSLANDLRRAVSGCAPVLAGLSFPAGTLSISIGVACRSFEARIRSEKSDVDDAIGEQMFRAADAALYAAKEAGRNRAVLAAPISKPGSSDRAQPRLRTTTDRAATS